MKSDIPGIELEDDGAIWERQAEGTPTFLPYRTGDLPNAQQGPGVLTYAG